MMAKHIKELSPQELMDYMNRVIQKHKGEIKELKEAPSHFDAQQHLQRMTALEGLFTDARLLSMEKGYVTWH